MKSSLFLIATSALLASAGPMRKRAMVTDWVTDLVYVTVYEDGTPVPTQPAVFIEQPKQTPAAAVPDHPKVNDEKAPPKAPTTKDAEPQKAPEVKAPEPTKAPKAKAPEPQKAPEVKTPQVKTPEVKTPQVKAPEVKTPQVKTPEAKPKTQATNDSPAPASGNLNEYQKKVIEQHTLHRSNHSINEPMEYSDTLAQYALNTAKSCVFEHDMHQGKGGYGQNLASQGSTDDPDGLEVKSVAQAITDQWYNGEVNFFDASYGLANPVASLEKTGHFSQVVWKGSKKVGCATVRCPAGTIFSMPSYYSVCNYEPAGNYVGEYSENVLPPKGMNIVVV